MTTPNTEGAARRVKLLQRLAERLRAGITTGHDWPNTDDELLRLQCSEELRAFAAHIGDRGRRADMTTDDELIALLPGVYYMDPPDGGGVSVYEQLRRMSEDAAKRRAQTQEAPAPSAASLTVDQMDEIASATIGDYNLRQSRRLCRIVAAVTRGADMEEAIAAEYAAARAPVDGEATLDQRDKP